MVLVFNTTCDCRLLSNHLLHHYTLRQWLLKDRSRAVRWPLSSITLTGRPARQRLCLWAAGVRGNVGGWNHDARRPTPEFFDHQAASLQGRVLAQPFHVCLVDNNASIVELDLRCAIELEGMG
jgi:hypothetical protein